MLFSPGEEQGEESRKLAEIRHHRHVSQALRAKSPNERPRAIINEVRAIKLQLEAFNRASNEFASRRMDKSIRSALAGHKIDELRI